MSKNEGYTLLCGHPDLEAAARLPALRPFDPQVMEFLAHVSERLLRNPQAKPYPDVITFAFFCRRANLTALPLSPAYATRDITDSRLGRGLTFHIAPSNVPVNFAYSLVSGLLSGNACIVKASSQDFIQTRIICAALAEVLREKAFTPLTPYVNVVTYERVRQDLTERFSALCAARLIWGGDETVRRVRQAPLSPFAFDVTFADRYSLLCLTPESVLSLDESGLQKLAQGFYNDTFLTDQNACTAPRLVYWVTAGFASFNEAAGFEERGETPAGFASFKETPAEGEKRGEAPAGSMKRGEAPEAPAQARFWNAVHQYAASRYALEPVMAVDKLTALYRAAVTLQGAVRVPMKDNLITRVAVPKLTEALLDLRCPGGFFVETSGPDLHGLLPIAHRKVQTLSYLGIPPEDIRNFVLEKGLRGIDRIVPLGHTLDFSLVWDGQDLIRTLSRQVSIT